MRILISNDDGIQSEGLLHLARMAADLGEVWIVAPAGQRSAMSQRITVFGSVELCEVGDYPVPGAHVYTLSGTPADCVKVALNGFMAERPDIVFSGINQGYNAGLDILYSGTIGAAMEALTNEIPAIAYSVRTVEDLRIADAWMPEITRRLMRRRLASWELWNVNFPSCDPSLCRGIKENTFPSRFQFYRNTYIPGVFDGGTTQLTLSSETRLAAEPGSDIQALLDDYISVGTLSNAILQAGRTGREV